MEHEYGLYTTCVQCWHELPLLELLQQTLQQTSVAATAELGAQSSVAGAAAVGTHGHEHATGNGHTTVSVSVSVA